VALCYSSAEQHKKTHLTSTNVILSHHWFVPSCFVRCLMISRQADPGSIAITHLVLSDPLMGKTHTGADNRRTENRANFRKDPKLKLKFEGGNPVDSAGAAMPPAVPLV
jgi:hypothetical protein